MTSRSAFALSLLLLCVTLSVVAPHIRPRREERHTAVEVRLPSRIDRRPWTMEILIRSVHDRRRRVFVRGIDIDRALVPGATIRDEAGRPATVLPFAGVLRVEMREEASPDRPHRASVHVQGLAPGRYQGAIDVLLDASVWVRREVEFEVLDADS